MNEPRISFALGRSPFPFQKSYKDTVSDAEIRHNISVRRQTGIKTDFVKNL
jgi:hypothetical protein